MKTQKNLRQQHQSNGFGLIELVMVVAILAVLAAIAIPSYRYYLKKTRLSQAKQILLTNSHALDQHYQRHLNYKANSTTWMTLPVTQNDHFCFRLVGNPRGAANERYNVKAVALDSEEESRVMKISQDGTILLCAQSSSRCSDPNPYFSGGSAVDKECRVFGT